jgi:hypothetical protein
MDIRMETVTPAKAETWLNLNKNNRKLRDGVAERYADDMKHGRWTNCPEPISFYADGDLADGQHRLFAVIESGTTQHFPIARGLRREDGLNINTGLTRSLVDNARISGEDNGLSNELISVARAIETGAASARGGRPLSNAEKLAMVAAHREVATWAIHNGPKGRGLRNAAILAAVARAMYYETDSDRLKRFCDVFTTGFADGEKESAAIALRNYFLTKPALMTNALWADTFIKAQNAIQHFMAGKRLSVIKSVATEPYPLKKARKAKRSAA